MDHKKALAALFLSSVTLGGCASAQGEYPSLAIRDVERAEGQFEPVDTPTLEVPEVPLDRSTDPAALVRQAQEAHSRFTAALGPARTLVAAGRGAEAGSNAWGAAQVAMADLESIRSDTAIALGDLDILHVAANVQNADSAAIDAAREEVIRLVVEEDTTLAELRSSAQ